MNEANQETGGHEGLTEEQGVSELLSRWAAKEPKKEKPEVSDTETQDEPLEQPQGEAEVSEGSEDDSEDDSQVEIDVGGAKFKAPKALQDTFRQVEAKVKEIEAGATRKFQEAADQRKAVEAQYHAVAQLQKIAEANADLLADHRMVARRLQQLESADINNIGTDELTRLNAEFNRLQSVKARIESEYGENVRKMQEEDTRSIAAKREHAEKVLASEIKGWNPEYGKKLAEYAVERGAPSEVLMGISDAWMVRILDDAAFGYAMRQKKPEIKRVAETQKTLTSGSGNTKPAATAKIQTAEQRFKKSHSVEDAANLLLARAASKRK